MMLVVRPFYSYRDILLGINMGNQQWISNNKVIPVYVQINIYIYIRTHTHTPLHVLIFTHSLILPYIFNDSFTSFSYSYLHSLDASIFFPAAPTILAT